MDTGASVLPVKSFIVIVSEGCMWILILTLVSGNGHALSTAEFNSEYACKTAGNQWLQYADGTFRKAYFSCVSKGEKQ